jgi:xylulose-5-phosphate/fructose-6-phosphate phosphoketolase
MTKKDQKALASMKKFLRFTDYMGAAMLYLKGNYFLEDALRPEHMKERILGHWGTVPGLNFIYANLNYLICKHDCKMLLVVGPGHGAPAILASLFAEGTLGEFYPAYRRGREGFSRLIHDFSWPHSPFPSHVTPSVPGSILEGGELGYSLSTAYGSVMDNPDLITAVIVGDGEAETGAIATAWHANKFLNPRTSGAVLPIVHINGYKISNPTILGRMDDRELTALFRGYGYEPLILEAPNIEEKMIGVMEEAYVRIRAIQKKARGLGGALRGGSGGVVKPMWPVILLRSPKGWGGIQTFHGHSVEGSFRAHGVPVGHPKEDKTALEAISDWLEIYKIHELVDKNGMPKKEVLEFVPTGKKRMGMCAHAVGGALLKPLDFPRLSKYEVKFAERGSVRASSMKIGGKLLRDLVDKNPKNFRVFCPDELESNLLTAIFEKTGRAFMWPIEKNDEFMDPRGRVIEMLSEHTLQGFMMGYLLTGRHAIFPSYEAFLTIVSSMVDQYAKFLKQSFRVKWRKPVAAAIYLLTSVGWRQDHNGYSHQNPSFVSNLLEKHGEFCQIYYPADANSFLVALEETGKRKDAICAIVAGKRDLPQFLTLSEARAQAKNGIAVWDFVTGKEATKNPDVVVVGCGDYMTGEAISAVKLCHEIAPEIKIRFVNISELTALSLGDPHSAWPARTIEAKMNEYFTADKPVIVNYHGYTADIEHILWPYVNGKRFSIHGYRERGSTTTPFDLKVVNKVDRYHLVMDIILQAVESSRGTAKGKRLSARAGGLMRFLEQKLADHQKYIVDNGDDPKEVKE